MSTDCGDRDRMEEDRGSTVHPQEYVIPWAMQRPIQTVTMAKTPPEEAPKRELGNYLDSDWTSTLNKQNSLAEEWCTRDYCGLRLQKLQGRF